MKTDDLIALLASDPLPAQGRPTWQTALAFLAGTLIVIAAVIAMGVHKAPIDWLMQPTVALKTVWLLVMGLAMASALQRLSRPGRLAGAALWICPLAWLTMAALAVLTSGGQTDAWNRWMGQSWTVCSINILALSVPFLSALLWGLRDMAPTQPTLTGGVAGLLAGCLAASLYSLHCTETSLGFFTLWYGGGITLSGALGAAIGQRCLRW